MNEKFLGALTSIAAVGGAAGSIYGLFSSGTGIGSGFVYGAIIAVVALFIVGALSGKSSN